MIRLLVVGLAVLWCGWVVSAQSVPVSSRAFTISHYDVELRPEIDTRTVTGSVSITVRVPDTAGGQVTLNRGALEIDEVRGDGRPLTFRVDRAQLQIDMPSSNGERTIAIRYHGRPTSGLVFAPEREQLYTVFTTAQWMPSVVSEGRTCAARSARVLRACRTR
jgi:aminopeptidase N